MENLFSALNFPVSFSVVLVIVPSTVRSRPQRPTEGAEASRRLHRLPLLHQWGVLRYRTHGATSGDRASCRRRDGPSSSIYCWRQCAESLVAWESQIAPREDTSVDRKPGDLSRGFSLFTSLYHSYDFFLSLSIASFIYHSHSFSLSHSRSTSSLFISPSCTFPLRYQNTQVLTVNFLQWSDAFKRSSLSSSPIGSSFSVSADFS